MLIMVACIAIFQSAIRQTYKRLTRELPGVALVNISNGYVFMGKGNTVGEGTKLKHV